MISKQQALNFGALAILAALSFQTVQARSYSSQEESVSAVIPSPNQEFGSGDDDIIRKSYGNPQASVSNADESRPSPARVPVYVSPFARADEQDGVHFDRQESSHAPPNYAPLNNKLQTSASAPSFATPAKDLKTSASYGGGHHHHGGYDHGGYDHSGWLDMGAWTGGKGSFGWYADYPVGSKGHHGYGRK